MSNFKSLSLTLLTFLSLEFVGARKTYLVKQEHDLRMQPPVVQQSTYDCQKCWFKNDGDFACIDYGADWEVGWNWY